MSLEPMVDLVVLALEDLDLVALVLVIHLFLSNLVLERAYVLVQVILLIVEFVLQC